MKVTMQNKLVYKGVTMEILKISKSLGITARDEKLTGQPPVCTGFQAFGLTCFWNMVREGQIVIK